MKVRIEELHVFIIIIIIFVIIISFHLGSMTNKAASEMIFKVLFMAVILLLTHWS